MTILVTGASGQLGSEVINNLQKNFTGKLIAGSRDIQKIKNSSVEKRVVDFDKPDTLLESFRGVDKLLIISTDSLAVPGLRLKQHKNAIEAAKIAGVRHVYYTSLSSADKSSLSFGPDHKGTEEALKASGLIYTILRNNWYIQNLAQEFAGALSSGVLPSTTGNHKIGFLGRSDCARAAASALLSDKLQNQTIEVTGEVAYSYPELALILSELHHKPVKHLSITPADLTKGLESHGLPPFVVDLVVTFQKAVSNDEMAMTNSFVKEATGSSPQDIKELIKSLT